MSVTSNNKSGSSELSSQYIPPDNNTTLNTCNTSLSFSFQIPGVSTGEEDNDKLLLLADEDGDDFFRHAGGPGVGDGDGDDDDILADLHEERKEGIPRFSSPVPASRLTTTKLVERPKLSLNIKPIPRLPSDDLLSSSSTPIVSSAATSTQQQPEPECKPLSLSNHTGVAKSGVFEIQDGNDLLPLRGKSISRLVDANQPSSLVGVEDGAEDGGEGEVDKMKAVNKREDKRQQEGRRKMMMTTTTKRGLTTLKGQRKVIEGGIAKSRIAASNNNKKKPGDSHSNNISRKRLLPVPASGFSKQLPEGIVGSSSATRTTELSLLDASTSSIHPLTGVAGRLMRYGRNLYMDGGYSSFSEKEVIAEVKSGFPTKPLTDRDTFVDQVKVDSAKKVESSGLFSSIPTAGEDTICVVEDHGKGAVKEPARAVIAQEEVEDDKDKPLTLSQLSPRKQLQLQGELTTTERDVKELPPLPCSSSGSIVSPMRPASKRPIDVAKDEGEEQERRLKKSKGEGDKIKERPLPKGKQMNPVKDKLRVPSKTRTQLQGRKPSTTMSRRSDETGVQRTKKNRIVSTGKIFNPGVEWNDGLRLSDDQKLKVSDGVKLQNSNEEEKMPLPCASSSSNVMNTRGESRSTSRSQSSNKHRFYHPTPDFKAIHAAFDASLAQRKENVHPTVPIAVKWETEMRLEERKKFEERLREKEREKEKEEEEKRKLREIEEEKEVKELRKRLVIKAHEVPEWYKKRN